jgi:hypothetical protein
MSLFILPQIVHWYYPSAIIGCGLHIEDLRCYELACLRSEVTCPACLAQLSADRKICTACQIGAPEKMSAHLAPLHVCDPARVKPADENTYCSRTRTRSR